MTRQKVVLGLMMSGLLWMTCTPPEVFTPSMFLTPRPRTIDDVGQVSNLTLYVADSEGTPKTGSVTVTAAAGAFATGGKTVTLDLDEGGHANVDWSCRKALDPACDGDIRVEARWESGSEFLVQVVRISVGAGDGGTGDGGGIAFPMTTGVLKKYVSDAGIWTFLSRAAAVDSRDRLFVTDSKNIYVIENGVPSVYLAEADAPTDAGAFVNPEIVDLDVASDDKLYVLYSFTGSWIARVPAAHQFEWVAPTNHFGFSFNMSAATPDRFYVANGYDGLLEVTAADAGSRILYDVGVSDCAAPNLTAFPNFFFYTPGCNGSPIVGGRLDGSGSREVFRVTRSAIGFGRSLVANHVVGLDEGLPRLLYVGPDGGSMRIATAPTLANFAAANGIFWNYYDLVQGPTGTIYMVSGRDILAVTPTP